MEFKPGDIIFTMTHGNFISESMSWFMQSKYSHVLLFMEEGKFARYISETSDFEVWTNDLNSYLKNKEVSLTCYRSDLNEQTCAAIVAQCQKNQGKVYGYVQIISLGIRRLLMRAGIRIKNFFRQGLVCCHHVLYGYRISGITELAIDPESIDTQEFLEIIEKSLRFKKVFEKKRGEVYN